MSDRLITDRQEKIALWESLGFPGFAKDFTLTHTTDQAHEAISHKKDALRSPKEIMEPLQSKISLAGRIIGQRDMGKLAFLKIQDATGSFQICLSQNILGDDYKTWIKALDLGDHAGFTGEFFLTKHGEPSLMALSITPLSKALRPLPEKWRGLTDRESCYRERNLDLVSNRETFKRFKIRSQVIKTIRQFYEDRNFLEVETPMLQPKVGGAMAKTFKTHHSALDHDFHLRIALELPLKIACSGGLDRLFEIGKCFRNEGTDPSHLQEFTMLEWYAAYVSFEQNLTWNEDLLREIATKVFGITTFTVKDKSEVEHQIDLAKPFPRHKFADLLKDYAGFDMFTASDDDVRNQARKVGVEKINGVGRANLLDDIYKKTTRPHLIQPCFVLDYPEDLKPLAAPNGDGTASCFQVLIAGWEVINAYGELIDPQIQRALLERQASFRTGGDDEAMEVDEVFLKAMEHGFPPMAGQGMGVDRIVALLTGQDNLRDVVLFPTLKPENSAPSQPETIEEKAPKPVEKKTSALSEFMPLDGLFNLQKAQAMLDQRCDWPLQRHLTFVAASMEALARHLGHETEKDIWHLTGLLHDIDWNQTIENPAEHCGHATMQYLADNGVSPEICTAIQSHHQEQFRLPIDSNLKKALLAVDEISGFAVAVALMRPTKMIGISPKSIIKKMKDKKFAEAVDRAHMEYGETYFNLPVSDLLSILIPAWESIAPDWELS